MWQAHLNLLSSELVLLLTLTPTFYQNVMEKNECVLKLLNLATGSHRMTERIWSVYPNVDTDEVGAFNFLAEQCLNVRSYLLLFGF